MCTDIEARQLPPRPDQEQRGKSAFDVLTASLGPKPRAAASASTSASASAGGGTHTVVNEKDDAKGVSQLTKTAARALERTAKIEAILSSPPKHPAGMHACITSDIVLILSLCVWLSLSLSLIIPGLSHTHVSAVPVSLSAGESEEKETRTPSADKAADGMKSSQLQLTSSSAISQDLFSRVQQREKVSRPYFGFHLQWIISRFPVSFNAFLLTLHVQRKVETQLVLDSVQSKKRSMLARMPNVVSSLWSASRWATWRCVAVDALSLSLFIQAEAKQPSRSSHQNSVQEVHACIHACILPLCSPRPPSCQLSMVAAKEHVAFACEVVPEFCQTLNVGNKSYLKVNLRASLNDVSINISIMT